jgi:PAS domain S-box-containing protein
MTNDGTPPAIFSDDRGLPPVPCWFLNGDDEMSARVLAHDWASTALGPPASWATHLQSVVGTMLALPFPTLLWWGGALTQIYNDAARQCFDVLKAPEALGQDAAVCWAHDWALLGAQLEQVASSGRAIRHKDMLIPILRDGQLVECYWTYSYTPLFGESGALDGIMIASSETTARVLAERRQGGLDLLRAGLSGCDTLAQVHACTRQAAAALPRDLLAIAFPGEALPEGPGRQVAVEAGAARMAGKFVLKFAVAEALPRDLACQQFLQQFASIVASAIERIEADIARTILREERDRLLLDAPVGAAVMIGESLTYQLVNPVYAMVSGRPAHWMVGKAFLDVFPELRDSPVHRSFLAVYRAGEPFVGEETLVRIHKNGGELEDRYFTYNLSPLRRVDGSVYGLMVIAVDITVQVESRSRILELNVELNKSSRAKDEFLALLGHELRNPLAPIVTALELMRMRDNTTQREQAVIHRQVTHLVRLVDDLLDVSRITRGKIELRKETVALPQLAAKAAEMVQTAIEKKRQRFDIEIDPIELHVDPARLAQVLSNLLTNASRHTPEGGRLAMRASEQGGIVTITVSDNGAGISAELLPRIFEAFVQGERKMQGSVGGLGIGLALVKNLVEMHDGQVRAHSAGEGQGSLFTITLPAGHEEMGKATPAHVHLPQPGADTTPRKVLVVDDNVDAADFLAELLASWGHAVQVAYDPAAALRLCQDSPPELAILDIGLPGMDGYQLAAQLRQLPACRDLPCVALTGFGQEADKARSQAAGFAGHLVKPIDTGALWQLFVGMDQHE